MSEFYTYLYIDPSRNEPIYVGMGQKKRVWYHPKRKDIHPFVQRLQKMAREGVQPEESKDKIRQKALGRKLSAEHKAKIGAGVSGSVRPPCSEATKAKIGAANRKKHG